MSEYRFYTWFGKYVSGAPDLGNNGIYYNYEDYVVSVKSERPWWMVDLLASKCVYAVMIVSQYYSEWLLFASCSLVFARGFFCVSVLIKDFAITVCLLGY